MGDRGIGVVAEQYQRFNHKARVTMKVLTRDEVAELTKDRAKTLIERSVYEATKLIEQLERAGKVSGNGHHARTKLAKSAGDELVSRWYD